MMPRDFKHSLNLVPLPCGCTADVHELEIWDCADEHFDYSIVQCPWCDTTFDREEHTDWLRSESSPWLIVLAKPPTLIEVEGEVLVAAGFCGCGCGCLLVKEPGAKQILHFDGDMDDVRVMVN
jgi:hypothetical protein